MKAMWTSEGGVSQVLVHQNTGGNDIAQDASGAWWLAKPGTIHETEVDARRAWLRAQETVHENELGSIDTAIQQRHTEIERAQKWLATLTEEREKALAALAAVQSELAVIETGLAFERVKAAEANADRVSGVLARIDAEG